jgi:hypothetical protein
LCARPARRHREGKLPPKLVVELVERFESDREVFQSPEYKEE